MVGELLNGAKLTGDGSLQLPPGAIISSPLSSSIKEFTLEAWTSGSGAIRVQILSLTPIQILLIIMYPYAIKEEDSHLTLIF